MDHEAFEKEMIDGVNRNAAEKRAAAPEKTVVAKERLFTRSDAVALKRGLKRMMIALLTVVLFGIAVFGFIVTAISPGYLAVLLFIASIVALIFAFVFLYAQGLTRKPHVESQGDDK